MLNQNTVWYEPNPAQGKPQNQFHLISWLMYEPLFMAALQLSVKCNTWGVSRGKQCGALQSVTINYKIIELFLYDCFFFPLQVTTQAQHLGEVLEHNGQQALPLHHILNHRLRGEEMLLLYRWFSPEYPDFRTFNVLSFSFLLQCMFHWSSWFYQ